MIKFLFNLIVIAVLLCGGWIVGSVYPAPPQVLNAIGQRNQLLQQELSNLNLESLQHVLTPEQLARLRTRASEIASRAGQAIMVERVDPNANGNVETMALTSTPGATAAPSAQGASATGFEAQVTLCPGMTVSNAPPTDANHRVVNYTPTVSVNGVAIAIDPTHGPCLSSGFGARGSGMHKGIDYYSPTGGVIEAAADGVVIERKYRDDYGNMLLIDHGHGVYTRYAHLSSFADGVVEGAHVRAGQQIGLMGNTASYQIPIHLHYELLLGDYNNPRASFGLTAHSPFEYLRRT